jgi:hypothetical protein
MGPGWSRSISTPLGLNNWQPAKESKFMNSKSRYTEIQILYYWISK